MNFFQSEITSVQVSAVPKLTVSLKSRAQRICHSFNVKQIKCMETMLMKVTQDMKALENRTTRTDLGGGGARGAQLPFFLVF